MHFEVNDLFSLFSFFSNPILFLKILSIPWDFDMTKNKAITFLHFRYKGIPTSRTSSINFESNAEPDDKKTSY